MHRANGGDLHQDCGKRIDPMAHTCRIGTGYPAIMVATDSQVVPNHEQITDLAWPEWTLYAIAKVDGAIDITTLDFGKHGFKRRQVSVDIGDDGDTHSSASRCRNHSSLR